MNLKSDLALRHSDKKNMISINIDNEKKELPIFLIDRKIANVDKLYVYKALNFLSYFLEKNILIPNNLNFSRARKKLESFFN